MVWLYETGIKWSDRKYCGGKLINIGLVFSGFHFILQHFYCSILSK